VSFFKYYTEIKKQYFFGGKLWTQSYFVETIGNANEETIRDYVQNQLNVMDQFESVSSQLTSFETRSLAAQ
jgi:putative transposase